MAKISISHAKNIEPKFSSSKEEGALSFLIEFRSMLLKEGLAKIGDIIPSKKEIAHYLNISTGTVQNAVKYAEDMGLFISKQCIGTMISDGKDKSLKMISKKDKAFYEIKKYLIEHKYEKNEIIPGYGMLANELRTSQNTIRLAVFELIQNGILKKEIHKKNTLLILNQAYSEIELSQNEEIKNKNLTKILKENIKKYLSQNYKIGDKIPTNFDFAKIYNVSARTINTAFRELNKEKIILSRRGNYGSIYINKKGIGEKSKFMSGAKPVLKNSHNYKWEAAMENIANYILKNHEAGDKILSMEEFSKSLGVSTSTVKRAVEELRAQGILFAQKGKYGGLFVLEMPQKEDSYQWLAVNPEYFK